MPSENSALPSYILNKNARLIENLRYHIFWGTRDVDGDQGLTSSDKYKVYFIRTILIQSTFSTYFTHSVFSNIFIYCHVVILSMVIIYIIIYTLKVLESYFSFYF